MALTDEQRAAKDKAEKKGNVYEKIFNIQQDIHVVIKGGTNEHFKYKFARERDVVAEVKPLLGREGLCVTHSLLKEEKDGELTKLTFKFRITKVKNPEDFVEADAIGYGKDGQDKGAPKAYTMALKYFLSKQFLIETGDDAENDTKKGGKEPKEPTAAVFEKAKRMITDSRNLDGLLEYRENLKGGKTFNATQKKELETLLKQRISELEPK